MDFLIDVFTHIFPKECAKELKQSAPGLKILTKHREVGVVTLVDQASGSDAGYYVDIDYDTRIKLMKRVGIEKQAICNIHPSSDAWVLKVPHKTRLKLARTFNDACAKLAEKYREYFIPIADVPISSGGEGIDELERAIKDLGFKGVQVPSSIEGKPIDLPEYRETFRKIEALGIPVLMHPTFPPFKERRYREDEYDFLPMMGWEYGTSMAVIRLAVSGMMDDLPKLKIITHHAGSMIPFFAERIQGYTRRARENGKIKINKSPMEYFKMMYHDTAIYCSVPAIKCAASVFGPDRIIFASDYPFGSNGTLKETEDRVIDTKNSVLIAGFSQEDLEIIFTKNALDAFNLDYSR